MQFVLRSIIAEVYAISTGDTEAIREGIRDECWGYVPDRAGQSSLCDNRIVLLPATA